MNQDWDWSEEELKEMDRLRVEAILRPILTYEEVREMGLKYRQFWDGSYAYRETEEKYWRLIVNGTDILAGRKAINVEKGKADDYDVFIEKVGRFNTEVIRCCVFRYETEEFCCQMFRREDGSWWCQKGDWKGWW